MSQSVRPREGSLPGALLSGEHSPSRTPTSASSERSSVRLSERASFRTSRSKTRYSSSISTPSAGRGDTRGRQCGGLSATSLRARPLQHSPRSPRAWRSAMRRTVCASHRETWLSNLPALRSRHRRGRLWDLGHDDYDRRLYLGPEHRRCNRSAEGKKSVELQRCKTSRVW